MKNLIIIFEKKKYLIDSIEELITLFFGDGYLKLSNEEKFISRYTRAFGLSKLNKVDLIHTKVGTLGDNGMVVTKDYNVVSSFVIDNEKTYILSLCKFRDFVILENKYSNIFGSNYITTPESDNYKYDENDNYIVVNEFVNELLLMNLKYAS